MFLVAYGSGQKLLDGWMESARARKSRDRNESWAHSFINDFFFFINLYDAWKELSVVVQRVDKTGVMGIKLGVPDCCSLPFL